LHELFLWQHSSVAFNFSIKKWFEAKGCGCRWASIKAAASQANCSKLVKMNYKAIEIDRETEREREKEA